MILEQLVKDIITEEHNKVKKEVPWDYKENLHI